MASLASLVGLGGSLYKHLMGFILVTAGNGVYACSDAALGAWRC